MEKSIASPWTIAWKHYLRAGLIMPFSMLLLLLGIGIGVIGIERLKGLILLGTISGVQIYILFYLLVTVLQMIAYFAGTRWSTEVIENRYEISDREKVILYATILLLIEILLLGGWSIFQRFSTLVILEAVARVAVSVGLFYIISRMFFLKKIVWSKFSVALLILFLVAAGGIVYLVSRIENSIDSLNNELTHRKQFIAGSVDELQIVPIGNPAQADLLLIQEILQEDFSSISVSIGDKFDGSSVYDKSRDKYAVELLALSLVLRASKPTVRIIGVTDRNLYAVSDPANNFVASGAFPNGKAIIVSTFHLKSQFVEINNKLFRERIQKSLRASLGTIFGLNKRPERECVMSIAKTLDELDKKGINWCGDEAQTIQRFLNTKIEK